MDFKDGLNMFITVTDATTGTEIDKKFLLCTSCTISYIIGDVPSGQTVVSSTNMAFIENGDKNVQVDFVSMDLSLTSLEAGTTYSWTMDVGYINESYLDQPNTYGIDFDQNMLGLAPMTLTNDATIDQRQFLRQFVSAASAQDGVSYALSYAFNASEKFEIGGSAEDYNTLTCVPGAESDCDENSPGLVFDNIGTTQ